MTGRATGLGRARVTAPAMARGSIRKGLSLLMSVLIVGPLLLTVVPAALAVDDTAEIAGRLVGVGTGRTTVTTTRDGTGGLAEFKYDQNLGAAVACRSTTWTFQTTAATTGTANLTWTLDGLHAWFNVTVGLDTFVTHGDDHDLREPLVSGGSGELLHRRRRTGSPIHGTTSVDGRGRRHVRVRDHRQQRRPRTRSSSGTLRVATNVVKNGSFETPVIDAASPRRSCTLDRARPDGLERSAARSSSSMTRYWNAADGDQSLDLDGEATGQRSRKTFDTVPGQDVRRHVPVLGQPGRRRAAPRRWPSGSTAIAGRARLRPHDPQDRRRRTSHRSATTSCGKAAACIHRPTDGDGTTLDVRVDRRGGLGIRHRHRRRLGRPRPRTSRDRRLHDRRRTAVGDPHRARPERHVHDQHRQTSAPPRPSCSRATVSPSGQGVTASIAPATVDGGRVGDPDGQRRQRRPTPGAYQVTVTAPAAGETHATAPLAFDVAPTENTPYLFRADPGATTTHVEGVLGAHPADRPSRSSS